MRENDECRVDEIICVVSHNNAVIPADAGIQKETGFRVKPGMTEIIRSMAS